MAGSVDSKKWAAWRQRLERFGRSGLPVTRFCAAEGVSHMTERVRFGLVSEKMPDAGAAQLTGVEGILLPKNVGCPLMPT